MDATNDGTNEATWCSRLRTARIIYWPDILLALIRCASDRFPEALTYLIIDPGRTVSYGLEVYNYNYN